MDRLKYFYSEFNTQGCREENDDVTALNISGAYLLKYLSDCLQILHTTPLGGLVVPFGAYEL